MREKYESNKEAMVILGKPLPDIQEAIPAAGVQAAAVSGSQVRERERERERRKINDELKRVLCYVGMDVRISDA